ncbi:EAL domain-containing protein [Aliamphritea hakodatensis]|uniref:EAL domain-containing protein n=1 Tax=Aliamphritea hakodatensis TaxID=2895352 RepID=UPI0022FD48E5|nr:EAL domain-containing protein [Aliamphritea hakodatensis]
MSRSLYWKITSPVLLIALVGTLTVSLATPYLLEWFVTKTAVDNAQQQAATFRNIRNYYSEQVVSKVTGSGQFSVMADHQTSAAGVPVPATFLIEMVDYDQPQELVMTDLISPYPFKNRIERKMDEYQKRAWKAVQANPDEFYVELLEQDGKMMVRAAQADTLNAPACVACHNNHPTSIKRDWKLGDVRGLLEVSTVVDGWLERGVWISRTLSGVTLLAFALVMLVNFRVARQVSEPLNRISGSLRSLSRGEDRGLAPEDYQYREVESLADAFNGFSDKERERKQLATKVEKLAYTDPLTGLANRTGFQQELDKRMGDSDARKVLVRIWLVDVDHFRDINDTLGYEVGDKVLSMLAATLQAALPADTLLARLGEDEFGVLLDEAVDTADWAGLEQMAEQVQRAVAEQISVAGRTLQLSASVGAACSSHEAANGQELILQANIALHQAKTSGRNRAVIHSPELSEAVTQRVELVHDMHTGLDLGEFVPFYQPQFDLQTGALIGAEALMRWRRKDGSLMPPGMFIPVAEQSSLIVPMGAQILENACRDCQAWQAQGLAGIRVAVNVSSVQFADDDLAVLTGDVLGRTGLQPALLELEVTESGLLAEVDEVIASLQKLHELGIELALDDFGTGYSSLSYLKTLPVDRLKIDREFVRDLLNSSDDQAILKMIVELGQQLNLKILAEGVEEAEQLALLKASGCQEVQGFYYAKPLPLDEFIEFARHYRVEATA